MCVCRKRFIIGYKLQRFAACWAEGNDSVFKINFHNLETSSTCCLKTQQVLTYWLNPADAPLCRTGYSNTWHGIKLRASCMRARPSTVLSGRLANEPMWDTVRCEDLLEEAAVCAGLQACSSIRRDKANTADQCWNRKLTDPAWRGRGD